MKYYVVSNLKHGEGDVIKDYVRGDTIDLQEGVAAALLEAGVLSIQAELPPQAVGNEPGMTPEKTSELQIGGAPDVSGEPSLDTPQTSTASKASKGKKAKEVDPSANL